MATGARQDEGGEEKKDGRGPGKVAQDDSPGPGIRPMPLPTPPTRGRSREPRRRSASIHNKIKTYGDAEVRVTTSSSDGSPPPRVIDDVPKLNPPPASDDKRPPASIASALNEGADSVRPPARKNEDVEEDARAENVRLKAELAEEDIKAENLRLKEELAKLRKANDEDALRAERKTPSGQKGKTPSGQRRTPSGQNRSACVGET